MLSGPAEPPFLRIFGPQPKSRRRDWPRAPERGGPRSRAPQFRKKSGTWRCANYRRTPKVHAGARGAVLSHTVRFPGQRSIAPPTRDGRTVARRGAPHLRARDKLRGSCAAEAGALALLFFMLPGCRESRGAALWTAGMVLLRTVDARRRRRGGPSRDDGGEVHVSGGRASGAGFSRRSPPARDRLQYRRNHVCPGRCRLHDGASLRPRRVLMAARAVDGGSWWRPRRLQCAGQTRGT
jgi:hypothetical protein